MYARKGEGRNDLGGGRGWGKSHAHFTGNAMIVGRNKHAIFATFTVKVKTTKIVYTSSFVYFIHFCHYPVVLSP